MVYYPIEALQKLDITDVGIILGGESVGDFVRLLGNGDQFGMRFTYIYQGEARGIADAVRLAERFVSGSTFMTILGDNVFLGGRLETFRQRFEDERAEAGLILKKVSHPEQYGVPRFDGGKIVEIVEKPKVPPSPYAVAGLYAYTPRIFSVIDALKSSPRGELEISDAHTALIRRGIPICWQEFDGDWFDCGSSFDSLLEASCQAQKMDGVSP
jgi:glucose-1-phosphate thymidylyltransferase